MLPAQSRKGHQVEPQSSELEKQCAGPEGTSQHPHKAENTFARGGQEPREGLPGHSSGERGCHEAAPGKSMSSEVGLQRAPHRVAPLPAQDIST